MVLRVCARANLVFIAPRPRQEMGRPENSGSFQARLREILFIHRENAHSRYFSETAYAVCAEPKELLIVKGASHVDLYDRVDRIPFDAMTSFFNKYLQS